MAGAIRVSRQADPLRVSLASMLLLLAVCGAYCQEHPPDGMHGSTSESLQQVQLGRVISHVASLQAQVGRESATIDSLALALAGASWKLTALTDSVARIRQQEESALATIGRARAESRPARCRAETAAALILIGMLAEIVGGTMLAGVYLSADQRQFDTLQPTEPAGDLAVVDIHREPVLNFLGAVGGAFLVIGFLAQFAGVLVTSMLPLAVRVLGAIIALVLPAWLLWHFLGWSKAQSRRERLRVLAYNVKRHFFAPVLRRATGTVDLECEGCLRRVPADRLQIWWLREENTQKHPYLHEPYELHFGHERCLCSMRGYDVFFDVPGKYPALHLEKATAASFLSERVPAFRAWYVKYHEEWTNRSGVPSRRSASEERLERVCSLLEPAVERCRPARGN